MNNTEVNTSDLKVFTNHIYELEKGVRRMVLYTTHGRNRDFVVRRLDNRNISYVEQPVGNGRINTNVSTPCACCSAARCTNLRRRRILSSELCSDMIFAPNANATAAAREHNATPSCAAGP